MKQDRPLPEVGSTVDGRVVQFLPHGAVVKIGKGISGLLHRSQVSWVDKAANVSDIFRIGDEVKVVVLDARRSPKAGTIFVQLSQLPSKPNPWAAADREHPVGSRAKAKVVGFLPFGATVELPSGFHALVHNSEISWIERKPKAQDVFKVGDEIEVLIQMVDAEKRRIHASHRQAMEHPWLAFTTAHPNGSRLKAKVIDLRSFGAMVQVATGLIALVHDSEVSWTDHDAKASDVLNVGDEVDVVILNVDPKKRRIYASYRQALA
jgi:small subunit ribosomal protein S1